MYNSSLGHTIEFLDTGGNPVTIIKVILDETTCFDDIILSTLAAAVSILFLSCTVPNWFLSFTVLAFESL
jgi:hypothetical protein